MIALVPLHSLAILGVALPAASSYWMDPSCNPYNLNREIDDSLQEAVDMAAYGLWRVHQEPPFMGSLADQMVGNQGANGMDGKDIFAEAMAMVPRQVGAPSALWNPGSARNDRTIIIKCGNAHLQRGPGNANFWEDPQFQGQAIISRSGHPPCSPQTQEYARTYPTGLEGVGGQPTQGPTHVILLCAGYQTAALNLPARFGQDWNSRMWNQVTFDGLTTRSMSVTMLHELMHCLRFANAARRMTGHLVTNNRREVYAWQKIKDLATQDKTVNAQGYAIVGAALWLKNNKIDTRNGRMSTRFRVGQRNRLRYDGDPHRRY